jgi:hypothetical protein
LPFKSNYIAHVDKICCHQLLTYNMVKKKFLQRTWVFQENFNYPVLWSCKDLICQSKDRQCFCQFYVSARFLALSAERSVLKSLFSVAMLTIVRIL